MKRAAAVLAAVAAALVAALIWRQAKPPEGSAADLIQAIGQRRFFELRLTGGFAYAPCSSRSEANRLLPRVHCSDPPLPGSSAWRSLGRALRRFQQAPARGSAEAFHRAGIRSLLGSPLGGEASQAVAALSAAVRKAPEDARLRTDLATSLAALAEERDEPDLLVRALAAAEEAVHLDPSLAEGLFNRGLILDRLFLRDRAREAWKDYLRADGNSPWADEARRRLMALAEPPLPETWARSLPSLHLAASSGDTAAVRKLVAASPQEALEYALEDLLGAWGELIVEGRPAEADRQLRVTRAIGEALRHETGEPAVEAAVAAIDRAAGHVELSALAAGLRAYRDGRHAHRDQLLGEATRLLSTARHALERGQSPLAAWARLSLAGVDLLAFRFDAAVAGYMAAMESARRSGSRALAGRAAWGLGLVGLRQGRFSESLAHFLTAASALDQGRERQNLGAVQALLAEDLRFAGQGSAAWSFRYRAAAALVPFRDSIRLHNVLWEGGWAAVEEGESRAGLALLDECVGLGARSSSPQRLAEALLWRSKIRLALGDTKAALDDLLRAREVNERTADAGTRERLAADLDYVEGEVRRRDDAAAALAPLSRAVDFYREHELYLDLPAAYLARFHAALDSGATGEAEQDLESALALMERRRDAMTDPTLRLSAAEAAQGLYDEMLLLRTDHGRLPAALETAERARALARPRASSETMAHLLAGIPRQMAVLEYARAGDRLFAWLLWDGRVVGYETRIPSGVLEVSVREFVDGIVRRDPEPSLAREARALHRLLIPPALAGLPASVGLVIVPDKALNSLPFAALKNPGTGRYLIEERPLRVAASADLRPRGGAGSSDDARALLVAATVFDRSFFRDLDPLPGAEEEVRAVRKLYRDPMVLAGADATKERVLAELSRREIFHFAGHAVFNSRSPERSYFVLAPNREPADAGMLFLDEIAARHLHLGLVVLSACTTIGSRDTRTGGVAGLARPFLAAGAAAVVGTLWSVRDNEASRLLPAFHRYFLGGSDAGEALRKVQLDSLRSPDPALRHPGAWAGYQVIISG